MQCLCRVCRVHTKKAKDKTPEKKYKERQILGDEEWEKERGEEREGRKPGREWLTVLNAIELGKDCEISIRIGTRQGMANFN